MMLYELTYSNPDFARMLVVSSSGVDSKKTITKSTSAASFGSIDSDLDGAETPGAVSKGFCRFLTISSFYLDDVRDTRGAQITKMIFLTLSCAMENRESAYHIYDHKNVKAVVEVHQTVSLVVLLPL